MRWGGGCVVWGAGESQALRSGATRWLAEVSILLLRIIGNPARGGTIDEEQGNFGNLPRFGVYSDFPFRCHPHFGAVDWRCEFAPATGGWQRDRGKAGGARGCRQGDSDEEFHTGGRECLGGDGNQPGAGAAVRGEFGRIAALYGCQGG